MGRRQGVAGQAKLEIQQSPMHERPHGVDASWVSFKSNPNLGVKVFQCHSRWLKSYAIGKYLEKFGLFPKQYAKFTFKDENGWECYAIVMEKVMVLATDPDFFYDSEQYLREKCENVGIFAYDLHSHNYGYTEDGSPVVVDVGHFEVNDKWFDDNYKNDEKPRW